MARTSCPSYMLGTLTLITDCDLSANCDGARHFLKTASYLAVSWDDAWHRQNARRGRATEGRITMITITRGLVAGVALAGAAVGLASPASADPVSGDYTATIIDPGNSGKTGSAIWTLTPCGLDCTHLGWGSEGYDLHRQGDVWTASDGRETRTLDNNSLILTLSFPDRPNVVIGLTRNG